MFILPVDCLCEANYNGLNGYNDSFKSLKDSINDVKFYNSNISFQVSDHKDIDIDLIEYKELIDKKEGIHSLFFTLKVVSEINISKEVEYRFYINFKDKVYIIIYKNNSCIGFLKNKEKILKDNLSIIISNINTLDILLPIIYLNESNDFSLFRNEHYIYAESYRYNKNSTYYLDTCKHKLCEEGILITEPLNGSSVLGKCNIKGITTQSNNKSIELVQIRISIKSLKEWKNVSTSNNWINWNFIWNTINLPNGKYSIEVRALNGRNYFIDKIYLYIDQQFEKNSKSIKKPNYHIGDQFQYKNGLYVDLEDRYSKFIIPVINDFDFFKEKLIGTEIITIHNCNFETYIFQNEIEQIDYEYTSKTRLTTWINRTNLALLKKNFELTIYEVNGDIFYQELWTITYNYLDEYNLYSLKVGDESNCSIIKTINTIRFSPEEGKWERNFTYKYILYCKCLRPDRISISIGSFEVLIYFIYFYDQENSWFEEDWYENDNFNTNELAWFYNGYYLTYFSPEIGNIIKVESYWPYSEREVSDSSELINYKYGNKTYNPNSEVNFDVHYIRTFVGISIISMSLLLFITGTEIGKYGFFKILTPFYIKSRKKRNNRHDFIKESVHRAIYANPGSNYSEIKRLLELPNGTLTYYLQILEKEKMIVSERDGILKRFYPSKGRIKTDILELNVLQSYIIKSIRLNPGIFQKEIESKLNISQQRLNYHIKILVNARIIKVNKDGINSKCYLINTKYI